MTFSNDRLMCALFLHLRVASLARCAASRLNKRLDLQKNDITSVRQPECQYTLEGKFVVRLEDIIVRCLSGLTSLRRILPCRLALWSG